MSLSCPLSVLLVAVVLCTWCRAVESRGRRLWRLEDLARGQLKPLWFLSSCCHLPLCLRHRLVTGGADLILRCRLVSNICLFDAQKHRCIVDFLLLCGFFLSCLPDGFMPVKSIYVMCSSFPETWTDQTSSSYHNLALYTETSFYWDRSGFPTLARSWQNTIVWSFPAFAVKYPVVLNFSNCPIISTLEGWRIVFFYPFIIECLYFKKYFYF